MGKRKKQRIETSYGSVSIRNLLGSFTIFQQITKSIHNDRLQGDSSPFDMTNMNLIQPLKFHLILLSQIATDQIRDFISVTSSNKALSFTSREAFIIWMRIPVVIH